MHRQEPADLVSVPVEQPGSEFSKQGAAWPPAATEGLYRGGPVEVLPGHGAAEQEAEHEDEEADAQDDDVDVEGQVEELLRGHVDDLQDTGGVFR